MTELLLEWLAPFITRVERDRTDRGLAPGRQPPARLGNTDPSRNLSDVASPARGVDHASESGFGCQSLSEHQGKGCGVGIAVGVAALGLMPSQR